MEFFNHTPVHAIETEMSDICNLIISNSLKEIQTKIDEAEMKAKAFKPHLKVLAMISIGFSRRTYLDRMNSPMQPSQGQRPTRLPPIAPIASTNRSNSLSWALEHFLQENLAQAMSAGTDEKMCLHILLFHFQKNRTTFTTSPEN